MIAFEVYLNGKQICTAGVGDLGVLSTHVCWVKRNEKDRSHLTPPLAEEELTLNVGGIVTPVEEHVSWHENRPVQIGDEVRLRIVERETVDQPSIRRRTDPVDDEQRRKAYVKEMAKQLGWKIQET
jgi:hypothetical protein